MTRFDPVQLEILWGGLVAIVEEMGVTLKRTAYSEMVREANDFSCALFDATGSLVAQTDLTGSPGHLGSIRDAARQMLRQISPGELEDGDSLITNDPYIVAGHLPDIAVATPFFLDGGLSGFAVSIAHHTDVGGKGAGGHVADARQVFEEGLRIPVSKLYRRGEPNRDLIRIIEANVRIPYKEVGDLTAQLSANHVGISRLRELLGEHRFAAAEFTALAQAVQQAAEDATRAGLRAIPDGTYRAEEAMEDFDGTGVISLVATLFVRDGAIRVDYTGTGPQSEYGINSVYNYSYAYTSHAIKCLANPRVPMNEGVMRLIDAHIPEGTILNARFPAAVGARHLVNWHISSLIFRALAPAIPDRVIAGCGGTGSCMPQFGGVDPRTGLPFVQIANHSGGLGARADKDGLHCYPFPARAENTPVEVVETVAPLRFERLELIPDSGGPGRFRGGGGLRVDIRVLTKERCVLGAVSGRDRFAAEGLFSGRPGAPSAIILNAGPQERRLHPRRLALLEPNDVVSFHLPGGGGYGDPFERPVEHVIQDVVAGLVSVASAERDYGVVFRPGTRIVDEEATRVRRQRRPARAT